MKKKILHHTSIMIIFAVLVTFLAASVVTYNKLNTYMQRGVREEVWRFLSHKKASDSIIKSCDSHP